MAVVSGIARLQTCSTRTKAQSEGFDMATQAQTTLLDSGVTRRRMRLGPSVYAPRVARRAVFDLACTAQIPPRLADDAALVAGEIVTGAIRRTRSAVDVTIEIGLGNVHIEVEGHHPARQLLGGDESAGSLRRTAVVSRLADAWGNRRRASGWAVWAVFGDGFGCEAKSA